MSEIQSNGPTRRAFIKNVSLAAGIAGLGGIWTEGEARASQSPNEKLNVVFVGVGGKGAGDLVEIGGDPGVNVVALCDVDETRAAASFNKYPNVKKYADFRVMLDKEHKNIDAVVVSTPDHCHAVIAVMAMKMGKHVYCQKPLAHSIQEVRTMQDVAKRMKVVTQMGTQAHPTYARTVELIQSGAIGNVHEVHVVTDRPAGWWPQGMTSAPTTEPTPATLNWDLWLGPAAKREYSSKYLPFVWRGWWDFGTGAMGDMACHLLDGPYWALNLKYPTSVSAVSDQISPLSPPLWSIVTYEFPKRGKMPPVKLIWYDGKKLPPVELLEGHKIENGSLFVGDNGKLLKEHGDSEPILLPEGKFADFKGPAETIKRYTNHYKQWVDACKTGGETGSNFEYACPLTETALLANVALRTGKKIEWNGKKMRATNAPEAEQYVKYQFRSGYKL